ncbi:MAG: helix-turn-helix transcriptional regulator [Acidimicrobiales bacterium]|jgi:DNA-binding PadR family transcriptional regulator
MAILGLLKEQPMHGYDLRKRLRSNFGLLSSLSFGSLYPALARLEHEGAVRAVSAEPEPSGPSAEVVALTGSLAGERAAFRARLAAHGAAASPRPGRTTTSSRTRKVYALTDRGEAIFGRLLTDDQADGKDGKAFALRWAFARHLSPEARMRLLERRRRQLEDRLSLGSRAGDTPQRPLDRFERSLVEHSNASFQFELDWIEQLIAAEVSGRSDVSGGAPPQRPASSEPAAEVS